MAKCRLRNFMYGSHHSRIIQKFVDQSYHDIQITIDKKYWKEEVRSDKCSRLQMSEKQICSKVSLDNVYRVFIQETVY